CKPELRDNPDAPLESWPPCRRKSTTSCRRFPRGLKLSTTGGGPITRVTFEAGPCLPTKQDSCHTPGIIWISTCVRQACSVCMPAVVPPGQGLNSVANRQPSKEFLMTMVNPLKRYFRLARLSHRARSRSKRPSIRFLSLTWSSEYLRGQADR